MGPLGLPFYAQIRTETGKLIRVHTHTQTDAHIYRYAGQVLGSLLYDM